MQVRWTSELLIQVMAWIGHSVRFTSAMTQKPNPLVRKLASFADLSAVEIDRLDLLCGNVRDYRAKQDLITDGDRPEFVFLLIDGWACRYKILPDGRRHIMAYLLPGDLCDPRVFLLKELDHSIGLLSAARVAAIPKEAMIALFDESRTLERAMWWSTLVDESILREWLVNIGQRDAFTRIAHLFAELWTRLALVGETRGDGFAIPLTQTDLGDTMGLTAVHMNRTLRQMRADGLIDFARGSIRIPDVRRLIEVSGFDPR